MKSKTERTRMAKASLFISYSAKDRPVAEEIHDGLESSGFEVWRDETRLESNWSKEIAYALADCDLLCLLWTKNAAASRWVKHEWLTARALEKPIIPCLLPDAPELPRPIQNRHGISFTSIEKGCETLFDKAQKATFLPSPYEFNCLPENAFIDFNPNPHFTGRQQDLLELYLKMIGNLNRIGVNQVGTIGMGGIGKTQLAVEFALRFSFAFDAVYWIDSVGPDKWLDKFVSLAQDRLGLEIKVGSDPKEVKRRFVIALQEHFKKHPEALLIMDDIDDPRELNNETHLLGVTPLNIGCSILFTTRRHFQLPGVVSQPVDVLSPRAAYELLSSYREPGFGEETHAKAICSCVGFLPLAIALAGGYLKRYRDDIGFADYAEELGKEKLSWIDIGEISKEELATRHIAAVTATLDHHWKMLKDEDARQLFLMAGQFPENAVVPKGRLGLLTGIASGRSGIDTRLARAFNLLRELSLVERLEDQTKAVRLHPLVREFSNRLVSLEKQPQFRSVAAGKLKDSLFEFGVLEKAVNGRGVEEVVEDLTIGLDWLIEGDERIESLSLLQGALRLSSNVLRHSPEQLAEQLIARLPEETSADIRKLLDEAARRKRAPWLRPMRASLGKPGGPLLRTLECQNQVTALVLMNDGKRAISGENDGTLTIWNCTSGTPTARWIGHPSEVLALGISHDGRFLVSVYYDAWLKTFDTRKRREIFAIRLSGMDWQNVSVARDGRIIAFAVKNGLQSGLAVLATDERYKVCREILRFSESDVRALALNETGEKLFWIVGDNLRDTLKAIDIGGKIADPERIPKVYDLGSWDYGPEEILAVSPDGNSVVFSSLDGPCGIWKFGGQDRFRRFENTKGQRMLAVSPCGKRGVSSDKGGALFFWDMENLSEIGRLSGHTNIVHAVAVTTDGRRAFSAGGDNTVKICDLHAAEGHFSENELHAARAVTALALSPDGRLVASGSWQGEITIWNIRRSEPVAEPLRLSLGPIDKLSFMPDSNRLLFLSEGRAFYCDMRPRTCQEAINPHGGWHALSISPDGRKVLLLASGEMRIVDSIDGKNLFKAEIDVQYIMTSAITSAGTAVFWSDDGKLGVIDQNSGQRLPPIDVDGGRVSSMAVSPDGGHAILGLDNGGIQTCHLKSRAFTTLTKEHGNEVLSIAVVPGWDRMVSSSLDGSLAVWDLQKKETVARFHGDSPIKSCAIAEDGGIIVAGESSGRMHFLSVESGDAFLNHRTDL